MIPIEHLINFKTSDTIYFLGSGSSINDITMSEWDYIKEMDSIALNNWIYHPFFVPNFYHLELKYYDFEIFKSWMNVKRENYKDTKFIISSDRYHLKEAIGMDHKWVFGYDYTRRDCVSAKERENLTINADYKFLPDWVLTFSYFASITQIIELLCRMDYRKIILLGVDLYNPLYFWTEWESPPGLEYHHKYNKQHEHNDLTRPHNTYHIKDFIVDFNKRHMMPRNKQIYIGTKKSALYNDIEYIDILEG